jgi:hypothetical protein
MLAELESLSTASMMPAVRHGKVNRNMGFKYYHSIAIGLLCRLEPGIQTWFPEAPVRINTDLADAGA